jgi:enamine deaminase RidA (YjgF/YER057c/UK114 family)
MSQVCEHHGVVYLAGQVADQARGNSVADQTRQILEKIERYLEEVGSNKSRILQAMIWLTDMGDYADFNEIWDHWIDLQNSPARACVQAVLAHPDWKVELMIIAAVA